MTDLERTIANVDMSMSMEGMPLTEHQKQLGRGILSGKTTGDEELRALIAKHTVPESLVKNRNTFFSPPVSDPDSDPE